MSKPQRPGCYKRLVVAATLGITALLGWNCVGRTLAQEAALPAQSNAVQPLLSSTAPLPSWPPDVLERTAVPGADGRALRLTSEGSAVASGGQLVFSLPPSGRGTFVIHPAALGRPDPVRNTTGVYRDVWLVSVSNGQTIAVPPVKLRGDSQPQYSFLLCLPPSQPAPPSAQSELDTYRLRLFLVKGDVSTSVLGKLESDDGVYKAFEESPVTFEASVTVPRTQAIPVDAQSLSASSWPLVNGFSLSPALPRRKCTARDLNAVGEGWITTRNTSSATPPWLDSPLAWQASSCDFPEPNGLAIRRGKTGRWLAFVGDSSMQEQAKLVLFNLGVKLNESMQFELPPTGCHLYRMTDTGTSYPGMEGLRVSHFWTAGPKYCGGWSGVRSYDDADFLVKLQNRLTLGGAPDILVFNSGLHDMMSPFEEYAKRLPNIFRLLRQIVGPKCLLVWKSTIASTIAATPFAEDFNAVALDLLQLNSADGPVAFIDQYALTLHKFITGSLPGSPNHCSDHIPVSAGCIATHSAIAMLLDEGIVGTLGSR